VRLELGAGEARALAVAAMGRDRADSAAVLGHTGLLQLDPLSRVAKAHLLTCLARLPATARAGDVDPLLWTDTEPAAFEAWVHAVCLVPIDDWPLLGPARRRARVSPKRLPAEVLATVRELVAGRPDGATIADIERPDGRAPDGDRTSGWEWSRRKRAAEQLVRSGELVCWRRPGGTRVYDLPERHLPADLLAAQPPVADVHAAMARRALTAMGVATAADLATYYNIRKADAVTGLEAAGAEPVTVEGWDATGWILPGTPPAPAPPEEPVLLGPFDNLMWDRARVRRVFGFDYVFEAYKPAATRRYGHYVLALLDGDELIGRLDLCREGGRLVTLGSFAEPGIGRPRWRRSSAAALARLAGQLGLTPG
jgi:hypothetical protein